MTSLCPRELREKYREGRLVPFIGAGVSMNVRWQEGGLEKRGLSWSELVDKATHLLGFQYPELARIRGTDLQILEYFKLKSAGQIAQLTNWLATALKPPDAALVASGIHSELAKLTNVKLIYTTNYDDFLERSLRLLGRACISVAVESQIGTSAGDCTVVKFHGDLNHPSHIVLTERDYETRLKLESAMDYKLRADLLGRVVLFLGYSFRDPNVSYLFRLFTETFLGKDGSLAGPRAYIAIPDPSDFEYQLFQRRSITVIPIRGTYTGDDTASLLAEMRE